MWQSNYCAGLRVLDEAGMVPEDMQERAFFDLAPECDTAVFTGKCVFIRECFAICAQLV